MKKCNTCLIEKEQDEFCKTRPKNNKCRACLRETSKKFYNENREKELARSKKWREENKDLYWEICQKRYQRNFHSIRKRANDAKKNEISRNLSRIYNKTRRKDGKIPYSHDKKTREKYPERHAARRMVIEAIKLGILFRPEKCEKCNMKNKVNAHHDDYQKPLQVRWLCHVCHCHVHGKLLDVNPKDKYGYPSIS